VIEPLKLTFEVKCPAPHAFDVWTAQISRWWPGDHTVSAEDGLTVVLERKLGGRIYERTSAGTEFEWGEVTVWEPPRRLAYLWHLRRDRADATEVEITFVEQGDATTRVEIEHRGWEHLGAAGQSWRDANYAGWSTLVPHYIALCSE
jgi:Activator of Hsp90 ATPase homolog 1-like protein